MQNMHNMASICYFYFEEYAKKNMQNIQNMQKNVHYVI